MSTNSIAERIASNVRAEMARNSYTQGSVADRMGRSQHYISRRLTGRVPFDTDDLTAIAEILGVKFSDLVSGPERTEAAS